LNDFRICQKWVSWAVFETNTMPSIVKMLLGLPTAHVNPFLEVVALRELPLVK